MAKLVETYACIPSTERGRGILISADPKTNAILYCNGRSIIIRQLDKPLDIDVYTDHGYPTTVARFSPNGEWVASADASGTVRIWGRYNDHVLKNEFRVLTGRVDDLMWSADGLRIVASGDCKGKAFVRAFMWDSGSTVGDFDGHSRRVLSCAFKPTRPFRIVTCGEDFLVNFYEGPPFKFKLSHRDHTNYVNCVRFSPDGTKFVTVSSDKKGILYDAKTADKIGELSAEDCHKGSIYAVSWSPDSKQLITASADKTAKVWTISEDGHGELAKTLTSPGSGSFEDMLVGCLWHNNYLVTVSLGGTISIFSATDLDESPVILSGHMKNVNSVVVLKKQNLILSCSYDGLIVKWTKGIGYAGKLDRKVTDKIKCFAAVDEELVTSGYDNKVWRTPLDGDQCGEAECVDIGSQPQDLSFAMLSPKLVLVAIATGVVLLEGTKVLSTVDLGFSATACTISPDGSEAVVGGEDGKLHIYSISGNSFKEEAVLEKHRGAITVVRYSPDVSMIASGDVNREAVVWDRASREVKLKNMLYHAARVNCLSWSHDSTMVATGSLDTCVIIYEIGKPASSRITIKGAHLGGVYGLAFTEENSVISSGEDGCVRIWTLAQE
ncbi:hypothetical protein DCAR_0622775 [Daucus carota subsp. sativus]|uniref:Uncharacterized protein n=1 Tax=Daucus carota subsp. sativus TaxID=79200 RepID=A0A164UVB3_DAUCS|nr:PREDICTED: actin-interacting protein 1-2-like [Daucus carota subsp. sativus]WOH03378.1 hypothetical protein DCAR_0622775 [Daucus carota subsp. sativus]